jgi:DNA repair protein SbcC/Rad50
MIPVHLHLSGFLSYRDPVDINFRDFELSCIAGPNGAGKSSLLDAITWALFGQARKRDDSIINTHSDAAEVTFTFDYEGNTYRVIRSKTREKSTILEFQILQGISQENNHTWKPLTESSIRQTEARIQEILRMDYETFINASFFLQGKADQFTQQRPGDRKRILSGILGLEIWEQYRQKAADRRKEKEQLLSRLDGRLHEIAEELSEEVQRRNQLAELEKELDSLGKQRQDQEAIVNNIRQVNASLAEQRKWIEAQAQRINQDQVQLEETRQRLAERIQERDSYTNLLDREQEINAAYENWQEKKRELENWEQVAQKFREQEAQRAEPRSEIQSQAARLEGEAHSLEQQADQIEKSRLVAIQVQKQINEQEDLLLASEKMLEQRSLIEEKLEKVKEDQIRIRSENPRLKTEMDEQMARIKQLKEVKGSSCPLCGQPMGEQERLALIEKLHSDGTKMGNQYRNNQTFLKEVGVLVRDYQNQIENLRKEETQAQNHRTKLAELRSQLNSISEQEKEWTENGSQRLSVIKFILAEENYAHDARTQLANIDAKLKEIGYDAAMHDKIRREEEVGRSSEIDLRALERAQASLTPLKREIEALEKQIASHEMDLEKVRGEHQIAKETLEKAQREVPNLSEAEDRLISIQESENRLRLEVGAAQQKVIVLSDLKRRQKELGAERDQLAKESGRYRILERAFGKDGVPALLIEQSLPEIERRANEILARLSAENMSVSFVTQKEYKNKNRNDMRETLEIQIRDNEGSRDYEMFSGGEAFRVNFAIRLALSEVLAQRAGARLQTLVIDEGFGSQDAQGRQRLVEAINLVRKDFEKILVITHIDELKDAFSTRIEVEKTARGSQVQVYL